MDYDVESFGNPKLMVPRVVISDPFLCLVNLTDRFKLVKKNALFARAFPVAEYISRKSLSPDNEEYRVQTCSLVDASPSEEATEHVRDLCGRSAEHLEDSERKHLADLLN